MPFTCVYWCLLGENNDQYMVIHRSILNDQITDKLVVIDRGPLIIQDLSCAETNHNRDLHRFTSDFCLIQEQGQRLRVYDLRVGYTDKFTRETINTPIMGYEFALRDQKIINTQMLPMAP